MKKALFTMLVVTLTMTSCSLFKSVFSSDPVVLSCDPRIDVQLVSCKRFGSTVTLDYIITNNSFGNVRDFRIYPPSNNNTTVYDNEGNHYQYATVTLGAQSAYGAGHSAQSNLLEGAPYKASVTIKGVPQTVTKISCALYIMAYQHKDKPALEHITFKNIPIEQEAANVN